MSRFREIVEKELASYGYSLDEDAKKDNEYLRHSINKFDEYIVYTDTDSLKLRERF